MKIILAQSNNKPTGRLYGFDSLRAMAVLFVVALHAAAPYVPTPMPGLLWVTEEPYSGTLLNGFFWGIACCIMPLFFCISGYFSYLLYERRGAQQFLSQRIHRILIPLVAAVVVILPVEVYLWALGMISHKGYPWKTLQRLNFDGDVRLQFWGLSHLWYLQYLFLYSLLFVLFERYRPRHSLVLQTIHQLATGKWLLLVLLVPSVLILTIQPQAMVGFQHSGLPVPSKFLYNAIFFALGIMAAHNKKTIDIWKRYSPLLLGTGLLLLPVMLFLIKQYVAEEGVLQTRLLLATAVSLFSLLMTLGCIGIVQKQQSPSQRAVLYLAEASFFLYLVHHPLVAILHLSLMQVAWVTELKFAVTFFSATSIGLLLYHVAVRKTWVGVFLNGRKKKPSVIQEQKIAA
ncbi:Glucans biosynthesis protein C [hydrothermal vent metagenome]|uniref:Glucans biosynthesis protein C n=1 Tax=hydrothermal vent metagenome TaxID=652676 RepID=A0A3B1DDX7_9ZZZZ